MVSPRRSPQVLFLLRGVHLLVEAGPEGEGQDGATETTTLHVWMLLQVRLFQYLYLGFKVLMRFFIQLQILVGLVRNDTLWSIITKASIINVF